MITPEGIQEVAQAILERISHGVYDLDGVTNESEIYKTSIEGNLLMVYLYFVDDLSGSLSNFKLISNIGNEFAIKSEIIDKPETKGLLVRFKFEVKEG